MDGTGWEARSTQSMASVSPARILLVDDEPSVARLQQLRLERVGHRVLLASETTTARAIIERGGIDLLILDENLGPGSGLRFYRELKADGHDLPVIMVTGFSNEVTAIEALREGVRDFVSKSIEYLNYLPEAVERVLEQVRTKRRLAESEQRMAAIIDAAMDAIMTVDESDRIILFNPAAERLFGCSVDQALEQPINSFIPEWSSATPWRAVATGKLDGLVQFDARRADGAHFPIEASVSRTDAEGRSLTTVILRDISERKRIEQALRENEARAMEAQRVARLGHWVWNVQTNAVYWSREVFRIFGLAEDEFQGSYEGFLKYVHPADRDAVVRAVQHSVQTGRPYSIDHRIVRPDASIRYLHEQGEVTYDADCIAVRMVGTSQDITERKLAEEALQRERDSLERIVEERTRELRQSLSNLEAVNRDLAAANRHKSVFLSAMSHELRTPLNAILGNADLLAGRFFGPLGDDQSGFVAQIQMSGKHLLTLINDLLDLAKIDAGATELAYREAPAAECFDAAAAMLQSEFRRRHVELDYWRDPAVTSLQCDPRRIRQVMLNLLSNALKYTPAGGSVRVRCVSEDTAIKVTVHDTGPGIAQESLEHVFEEFYQVDRGRDEALGGTGIGLALSKRLVTMHGGTIAVESTRGSGSTFWFTLPTAAAVLGILAAPEGASAAEEQARPRGRRILIVEDNEANRLLLRNMLAIDRHEVAEARDGAEAVALADRFQPELVLMDVRMPVLDGLEATRRLRANPRFAHLPIVALTASVGADGVEQCREAGCSDYLSKPIMIADLFRILERHLANDRGVSPAAG